MLARLWAALRPPAWSWWFSPPAGRPGAWWRAHFVAHVGHGIIFWLLWSATTIEPTWLVALWQAVLWEAWQRETWPDFPLNENVWDVLFASTAIAACELIARLV